MSEEKITYKQAGELLDKDYETITQAVSRRGVLTRCINPVKSARILRKQVELFKGKRLSLQALNLEELEEWKRLKAIAESTDEEIETLQERVTEITNEKLVETLSSTSLMDIIRKVVLDVFNEINTPQTRTPHLQERGYL